MGGTSTGAILALALMGKRKSAEESMQLYKDLAAQVFPRGISQFVRGGAITIVLTFARN